MIFISGYLNFSINILIRGLDLVIIKYILINYFLLNYKKLLKWIINVNNFNILLKIELIYNNILIKIIILN